MGVYEEALQDKALAARVVLPLIEFEFCFLGDEQPKLLQCKQNFEQLQALYAICNAHRWATQNGIRRVRNNFYVFSISREGFSDIFKLAGPFSNKEKNVWANLLLERFGKRGSSKLRKKTADKILAFMKTKKHYSARQISLGLRLLPSGIKTALRGLFARGLVSKKKLGKKILYAKQDCASSRTLLGATAV